MKHIDFTKEGGFPLTQFTLGMMQKAYNAELMPALISWLIEESPFFVSAGSSRYILSGVHKKKVLGTDTYTPGWLIASGELLYFAGATVEDVDNAGGIGTQTIVTNAEFKDQNVNDVYFEKYAIAGGDSPTPVDNYTRLNNLASLRPIIDAGFTFTISPMAPGFSFGITQSAPGAQVGDAVVVNIYHPSGNFEKYINVNGQVTADDMVHIQMMNVDDSVTVPGGDMEFIIRLIK